jgi:hypothetical protein
MIAALQKSRTAAPSPAAAPAPAGAHETPAPDALVEKFAAMDAKLDQILQLLGAEQTKEAPAAEVAPEASPNDDGN